MWIALPCQTTLHVPLAYSAGATGTIICQSNIFGDRWLVSWDGWENGHNDNSVCLTASQSFPYNSGWWVLDSQFRLIEDDSITSVPLSNGTVIIKASWSNCWKSQHRSGRYAKYYTFSLPSKTVVQIDLESRADTYLYLLSGKGENGTIVTYNDDRAEDLNSSIMRELPQVITR